MAKKLHFNIFVNVGDKNQTLDQILTQGAMPKLYHCSLYMHNSFGQGLQIQFTQRLRRRGVAPTCRTVHGVRGGGGAWGCIRDAAEVASLQFGLRMLRKKKNREETWDSNVIVDLLFN